MLVSGRVEAGAFPANTGVDAILTKGGDFNDILDALRGLLSGGYGEFSGTR
jgi:hypothetical protein